MKRLELLDYARFCAAFMVLLYHYIFNGISNGKVTSISFSQEFSEFFKYGYLGVEFFFMISGYVIYLSAKNRSPAEFAISRALRLYPAYWVAVIVTGLFAIFLAKGDMVVSLPQILVNLSMLQKLFGISDVDGVYWTLVYEVIFYACIFILLLLGLQSKLRSIFIAWPFVLLASLYFNLDWIPMLGGYFCFFSAGALIAVLSLKRTTWSLLSLATVYFLCINYSHEVALFLSKEKNTVFSSGIISIFITLYFLFFIFIGSSHAKNITLPFSKKLGEITYPLYLVHAHIGYMLIDKYADDTNKAFIMPLVIVFVLFLAFMINTLIEVKLKDFWSSMFKKVLYPPIYKFEKTLKFNRKSDGF